MELDTDFRHRDITKYARKPKLGSGKRFKALSSSLKAKGVKDPDALAAYIGRKKYGAKKYGQITGKAKRSTHKGYAKMPFAKSGQSMGSSHVGISATLRRYRRLQRMAGRVHRRHHRDTHTYKVLHHAGDITVHKADKETKSSFARFHDVRLKRGAKHSGLWYMTHPNKKSSPKDIVGHHGHKPHGPSILWPALYEHLRLKGKSKSAAARISNAAWDKKKVGLKTNTPTSVRGVVK